MALISVQRDGLVNEGAIGIADGTGADAVGIEIALVSRGDTDEVYAELAEWLMAGHANCTLSLFNDVAREESLEPASRQFKLIPPEIVCSHRNISRLQDTTQWLTDSRGLNEFDRFGKRNEMKKQSLKRLSR